MRSAPSLLLLALLVTLPAFAQDEGPSGDAPVPAVPEAVGGEATAVTPLVSVATMPLADALADIATDPLFTSATVGVRVVRVRDGSVVWEHGDDRPLIPASTMKLLTAATALRELGPAYKFPTWILTDGEVDKDGVLDGNLYVKGQGDPSMVAERMWRMALDVRLHGIKEVHGNVIFDASYFQDTTLIPGWTDEGDLDEGPTYFPPLGALSVNYNIAALVVRPGSAVGQAAAVEFEIPTPAVALEGSLTTGSSRSRYWVDVDREVDPDTFVATYKVKGNIPVDEGMHTVYRALSDPLTNYIGTFQGILKGQGVKVKGSFKPGTAPPDAKVLLTEYSDPLVDILEQMNKKSNNFMAEQILRCVGAEKYGLPGTTEKGVRAVTTYLGAIGVAPDGYTLVNGSGLSRMVSLRPSTLTTVLTDVYTSPSVGPEFLTTLSVGGRDGTLAYRFREDGMEGRMRGKTGTLNGVSTLAGYVRSTSDEVYAFAFLANDIDGAVSRTRRAHERLVLTLAGTSGNVADGLEGDAEGAR
jgi:D-alanyl-D-alanine carboxypeptidase/D-alanyl-D-alanine-endopeptidase (penicillin-binding protein 4)